MEYQWILSTNKYQVDVAKQKYLLERKRHKNSWFNSWLDYLHLRNKFNEITN